MSEKPMTMFELLLKELESEILLKNIFNILELDIDFPAPNNTRRSGKTTFSNIKLIGWCVKGQIDIIWYRKYNNIRDRPALPKEIYMYHHNHRHTKEQKRLVAYVLRELRFKIDEYYDRIEINRT